MILRVVHFLALSGSVFGIQAMCYRVAGKKHLIQAPWTFPGPGRIQETRSILDVWRCRKQFTRLHSSNRWQKGQESPSKKSLVDAATLVTLLTTFSFRREPEWSMSSAWRGQLMLSNAASWSTFSVASSVVKPRRASSSSIHRQRRTWTWLRYDESGQNTSRSEK